MVIMPSRQCPQFTGSAAMLVVLCVALAAAASTALAAGDGSTTSTSLAEACGNKLATPKAAKTAAEECKSFKINPGNAFTCDYINRQSSAAIGDSLATVFNGMAVGYPSGAQDAVHTVCALLAGKKSLTAACKAARDALADSSEAFSELCKASFKALPPAPPPPPSPPPPPPGPCDFDRVYREKCLDLFINNGTSQFTSQPDTILKPDQDCPTLRGPTFKCTERIRPDPVTKDCCNIISHRCLCQMKKEFSPATAKGGFVPPCFKNIKCP